MKVEFTPESEAVLCAAAFDAKRRGHSVMMPEHLLAALLKTIKIQKLLKALKISWEHLLWRNGVFLSLSNQSHSLAYKRVLDRAEQISILNDRREMSIENIFLALIAEEDSEAGKLLSEFSVEKYRTVAFFHQGYFVLGGDAS